MELLYLYIKRYDDVFENQQINFSSNYNIEYKDGCLNIEYKNNNMKGYYGDNIKNITLLHEYSYAAEPPVQFRLSHLSRRSEPL